MNSAKIRQVVCASLGVVGHGGRPHAGIHSPVRKQTMHTTLKKMIAGALLSSGVAVAGFALATGTANAFNPQPDPPGRIFHPNTKSPVRAFNPQPDPPGIHFHAGQHR
jgi:hypothetical protein